MKNTVKIAFCLASALCLSSTESYGMLNVAGRRAPLLTARFLSSQSKPQFVRSRAIYGVSAAFVLSSGAFYLNNRKNAFEKTRKEFALYDAALHNNVEKIRVELAGEVDINCTEMARCMNGQTPLIVAAQNGNVEAVEFLVKSGANIETRDENGGSALSRAQQNNVKVVKDSEGRTKICPSENHSKIIAFLKQEHLYKEQNKNK